MQNTMQKFRQSSIVFDKPGNLLEKIFAGRKFGGSQKPWNFCISAELNFAVHVLEQISREFNFAAEWKFRFSKKI